MTIGWVRTAYTVNENHGNLSICATAQNWTTDDMLNVKILTQNGTAKRKFFITDFLLCKYPVHFLFSIFVFITENQDFGSVPGSLTFTSPSVCVNITILDDNLQESDEHFVLMMTSPNTVTRVNSMLSTAVTNITIIDDSGKIEVCTMCHIWNYMPCVCMVIPCMHESLLILSNYTHQ